MGFFFCCLNFLLVHRARSFEQVATVSTLHIKGIPADFVVLELDIGIEDGTTADALMSGTDRTQVRSLDRW